MQHIIDEVLLLTRQAGKAVMAIYKKDFAVYAKSDASPITEADLAAHHIIVDGLGSLTPDIPVLSEESDYAVQSQRLNWSEYWLVDPLDGTKEFIKKNGEFTVNIALIRDGAPVFGVVYAPVTDVIYWGEVGEGAMKQTGSALPVSIQVATLPVTEKGWRVVGSRSHQTERFAQFMQCLPEAEIMPVGSSLKLCLIAEGAADLYPRFSPTSEWDIAAGQAVLVAAGGEVLALPSLKALTYNTRPETLINPDFVACAALSHHWRDEILDSMKGKDSFGK
ncbi:3'(2'),5'-bisphosphate nucleotidase CysQ [Neptunomonas qingdaonensis]|uniref:3'(2'),5'-bisphosphate nucleotidase CysQ n=1 Tax=Neptunomonas qingdaonensis TaxID=1045558 RepID=A0A1I2PSU0_9GAMM|nr:3'(2'),5'-bisphosphate nucleotidase CysQ [Neptunomonas qingdaonensis]SFG19192.1 3'(2'), 5'-bisphosphate nucleotidase [Neptunomonas qingdaonensis]